MDFLNKNYLSPLCHKLECLFNRLKAFSRIRLKKWKIQPNWISSATLEIRWPRLWETCTKNASCCSYTKTSRRTACISTWNPIMQAYFPKNSVPSSRRFQSVKNSLERSEKPPKMPTSWRPMMRKKTQMRRTTQALCRAWHVAANSRKRHACVSPELRRCLLRGLTSQWLSAARSEHERIQLTFASVEKLPTSLSTFIV